MAVASAAAALGHRKHMDEEESSSASEEEGMTMTPAPTTGAATTTPAPVAKAVAPAAAPVAIASPLVSVGPQALAAAMAALGQAVSGLAQVVVSAPPATSPVLGEPSLPKNGDTTVITVRYNVAGPASSMVDAKGNACLVISAENAKFEYETKAIADAAAAGTKLFKLTKFEHDGLFSQPCDLEMSYPAILTSEGTPLSKVLDQATLGKGRGLFSFTLVDQPLTATKLKFIQQQGKYHGKNLESVFIEMPNTGRVLILGQNPASMCLGRLKLNGRPPIAPRCVALL
jgi:hypothetical protein